MNESAFQLAEELNLRKVEYILHSNLWGDLHFPNLDLNFNNWTKMKYLNSNIDDFDSAINNVPDDSGGLYMFYIKCGIISGITEYPLYIGRAQYTEHQNLKKRVKEYFQKYSRNGERPKITKMFNYWSNELHLAYFQLNENEEINELEKQLINSLLLPMNSKIPDTEISQAINAF
jgi:excinuclease UvrABC nuclease subunit